MDAEQLSTSGQDPLFVPSPRTITYYYFQVPIFLESSQFFLELLQVSPDVPKAQNVMLVQDFLQAGCRPWHLTNNVKDSQQIDDAQNIKQYKQQIHTEKNYKQRPHDRAHDKKATFSTN